MSAQTVGRSNTYQTELILRLTFFSRVRLSHDLVTDLHLELGG